MYNGILASFYRAFVFIIYMDSLYITSPMHSFFIANSCVQYGSDACFSL